MTETLHVQPASVDPDDTRSSAKWEYTWKADEVKEFRQAREREAMRKERPTISRDSTINGGVYEGAYGGEAIVVDSEKYPDGFHKGMERVLDRIRLPDGTIDKTIVLNAVYDTVFDMMRYDQAGVDRIFQQDCGGVDGTKIALDTYIEDGVGVCRHQALFAGQLLESLGRQGFIRGRASVERNMVRNDKDTFDGHSWVRYENGDGEVYIIDVAQRRLAPLDDLMAEKASGSKEVWDYGRPEDHARLRGKELNDIVATEQLWTRKSATGMMEPLPVNENENGLSFIDKIPDWVLNPVSKQTPTEVAQEVQSPEQHAKAELANFRGSFLVLADRAIEQSGWTDPCSSAAKLSGEIYEFLAASPRLTEEKRSVLIGIQELGREIARSGRDLNSRYNRNQKAGLIEMKQLAETL